MATEARLGVRQILRNIVCIATMGFVFPNALMEEVDRQAVLIEKESKARHVRTNDG